MPGHAERGISAPPEVVFSTATDPDRVAAWLPEPLRQDGDHRPRTSGDDLRARWSTPGWSVEIQVEPAGAGGARVRIDLEAESSQREIAALADKTAANLARAVADNLTAG